MYDSAGRMSVFGSWTYYYDSDSRLVRTCHASTCTGAIDKIEFTYDGQGHRTQIKTTSSSGVVSTTDFAYQGDAIVAERLTDPAHSSGAVVRTYVVDPSGSVVKMTIAAGETGAGTYLVTWNGHGDALNLQQVQADGTLKLANAYSYSTWGTPTTSTFNSIPDLGFRFLYVGRQDVQWDNQFGIGLEYMSARSFAPSFGRFVQPDPAKAELNTYEYGANSPVSRSDPTGLFNAEPPGWHPKVGNWREIWFCVYHWGACLTALTLQQWAFATTRMAFGHTLRGDGRPWNAFLHCCWSAGLTIELGSSLAQEITDNHEYGDPNNDPLQEAIDLHNNAVGRIVGSYYRRYVYYGRIQTSRGYETYPLYNAALSGASFLCRIALWVGWLMHI